MQGQEWIVRVLLFAQAFYNMCLVQVFRIVRPVESATDAATRLVAAESAVLAITVRAVCALESLVVERIPHLNMII
jgi:hypothetical protein